MPYAATREPFAQPPRFGCGDKVVWELGALRCVVAWGEVRDGGWQPCFALQGVRCGDGVLHASAGVLREEGRRLIRDVTWS